MPPPLYSYSDAISLAEFRFNTDKSPRAFLRLFSLTDIPRPAEATTGTDIAQGRTLPSPPSRGLIKSCNCGYELELEYKNWRRFMKGSSDIAHSRASLSTRRRNRAKLPHPIDYSAVVTVFCALSKKERYAPQIVLSILPFVINFVLFYLCPQR